MTFASETWNCGKADFRKLDGLQYRQLRTIAGKTYKDKISHVQLLRSVKFGPNENFTLSIAFSCMHGKIKYIVCWIENFSKMFVLSS